MTDPYNPLVRGIGDFVLRMTEQYYLLVDPSIQVLAVTCFDRVNPPLVWKPVTMPIAWWKMYGQGKVYVLTPGHSPDIVLVPQITEMIRRGMVWAAR
jgi:type 1 glutamine amidotransferase